MAKDFSTAINEIMPLVNAGDKSTPFIISHKPGDADSPWVVEYPYPAGSAGEQFIKRRESDPYAVIYKGVDFDRGSFSTVHDMVLSNILRAEYYDYSNDVSNSASDRERLRAFINFAEDNIGAFSQTAVGYLTELDKPFAALYNLCPFNMATGHEGWIFNENLAADAVDKIEQRIESEIAKPKDAWAERGAIVGNNRVLIKMPTDTTDNVKTNHYENTHTISHFELLGYGIELGEDTSHELTYYVETNGRQGGDVNFRTENYEQAIREYILQLQVGADEMWSIREEKAVENGVNHIVLTDAHCSPYGKNADFIGQVVIVDAKSLRPEYRSSENQIARCSHGNGARPDAIGRSVFCKELYSGESVVYDRSHILGIADMDKLPKWAKEKLEIQSEPPVKQQTKTAAPQKHAQPEGKPKKKPSLLGELDAAVAEAAQIAEQKGGIPTKKRGDMEVD
jgi:hypothetical protein